MQRKISIGTNGRRNSPAWFRLQRVCIAVTLLGMLSSSLTTSAEAQPEDAQKPPVPTAKGATTLSSPFNSAIVLPPNTLFPILLNYVPWNNSLMNVGIQVNGALERCILDTGLNTCVVAPATAARFKLTPLQSQAEVTSLNGARKAPEADLKNLQIGSLKIDSLQVALLDASELYTGASQSDAPDIWLGMSFLSAFQVTIDYPNHLIVLNRPETILPKEKNAVILPIQLRDGRIYARISVPNGGTFSALIATGAMGTMIPSAVAAKLKIKPTKTFVVKREGGKQAKVSLLTLPKIQIGRLEQDLVPALYYETEGAKDGNKDGDKDLDRSLAVLGTDFLSRYKVTLDFAHLKMTLVPPPPPALPDNADIPDPDAPRKPGKIKPKK